MRAMTADDLLDSYVREVALHLPRARRQDIAWELRALLADELAALPGQPGQTGQTGTDQVLALLRRHGRPAQLAQRYHERAALIEPADTPLFLAWAAVGAVVLGLRALLHGSPQGQGSLFLQWLGLLLLGFQLAAWWRRRHPQALGWRPSRGPEHIARPLALLALLATLVFPFLMYAAPAHFVSWFSLGRLDGSGLALDPAFAGSGLRALTLVLLGLILLQQALVLARGNANALRRRLGLLLQGGLGLLLIVHGQLLSQPGADGQVFVSLSANRVAAPIFLSAGALTLLAALYAGWRESLWVNLKPCQPRQLQATRA